MRREGLRWAVAVAVAVLLCVALAPVALGLRAFARVRGR
jgi:hypothetical protein